MRKLLVCLVSAGSSERKINMKTLITTIAAVLLVGSVGCCLSSGGGLPVLPIVSPPLIFNDGGKTAEELEAEGK